MCPALLAAAALGAAYLYVAGEVFWGFEVINAVRFPHGLPPVPHRHMVLSALTWPAWLWRQSEAERAWEKGW